MKEQLLRIYAAIRHLFEKATGMTGMVRNIDQYLVLTLREPREAQGWKKKWVSRKSGAPKVLRSDSVTKIIGML